MSDEASSNGGKPPRITFLGTGDAFSTDGRRCSGTLVEWDGKRMLIDPGPTVMISLEELGITVDSLDVVFITHLHGDHISGMPFLTLKLRYGEFVEGKAIRVYGPTDTEERLQTLWNVVYGDVLGVTMPAVTEIAPRRHSFRAEDLDLDVEIFRMVHLPHSIGFRFKMGGKLIAFSGDTSFKRCVTELCDGADYAVLECSYLDECPYTHIGLATLRKERDNLSVPQIALNHLSDEIAAAFEEDPIRGMRTCKDGDWVDVV